MWKKRARIEGKIIRIVRFTMGSVLPLDEPEARRKKHMTSKKVSAIFI
jgi:hypothetical protein